MPTADDIAEKLAKLKVWPSAIPRAQTAVVKPSKKEDHPALSLKERALQLETRLSFFGVTRHRLLKELTEIPPGGYSPEEVPGNRETEAKTLQLFQKDFLPECISIMAEFRNRGLDVTKLRQRLTDVAGEGTEFEWIAGELATLADRLELSERTSTTGSGSASTLSIILPDNVTTVGPKTKVEVVFKNIPLAQHLWLIVKTPESGYWPHGKCNPANPLGPDSGPSLIERTATSDHWETPDCGFSRKRSPFFSDPDHHSSMTDQRGRSEATLAF